MTLLELRTRWKAIGRSGRKPALKVAVLATFTADPLAPYLGVPLEDAHLPAEVWVGPYHQILQECLNPQSATARYHPDVLVVWARLDELWSGLPLPLVDGAQGYLEQPLAVAEAALDAARLLGATLIFVLPAIPERRPLGVGDSCTARGVFATASRVREALRDRLAGQRGVLLGDAESAVRRVGAGRAYGHATWAVARVPFSEELFCAVGADLARLLGLSRASALKVVVLDADNTLWGGVVGEDGPGQVDLSDSGPGEAFRAFQAYLLELRRAGVLLALASKNRESDVWEVFARREMLLKKEHLAAFRIGYRGKADDIGELARELNVGVDSVAFIDDNPAEIAAVQAAHPAVACLLMPPDPAQWPTLFEATQVLDRLPPTEDDLGRNSFFVQEHQRREFGQTVASPEQYLADLQIEVELQAPASADLARLTQLMAKTNQFNLNGRRRSDAELAAVCGDGRYLLRMARARDRFGDYGVVGAMILDHHQAPGRAVLDTFLMSCRVLGRGVESAMLACACEEAKRAGLEGVLVTVLETPRNEPARLFFGAHGCAPGVATLVTSFPWPSFVARV